MHDHGHSHGLVHSSIKRSREGVRAVLVALAVLGLTATVQAAILVATGSIALLADLIHNIGDALTAVPLGIAFWLRSERAERLAGLAVVAAILVSALVAGSRPWTGSCIPRRRRTWWPWRWPEWRASPGTPEPRRAAPVEPGPGG